MKKTLLCLVCLFVAILPSCRNNEKRYELKGKIVAVEPEKHQVTVSHEDIGEHYVFGRFYAWN